jgi:hypothetical protein
VAETTSTRPETPDLRLSLLPLGAGVAAALVALVRILAHGAPDLTLLTAGCLGLLGAGGGAALAVAGDRSGRAAAAGWCALLLVAGSALALRMPVSVGGGYAMGAAIALALAPLGWLTELLVDDGPAARGGGLSLTLLGLALGAGSGTLALSHVAPNTLLGLSALVAALSALPHAHAGGGVGRVLAVAGVVVAAAASSMPSKAFPTPRPPTPPGALDRLTDDAGMLPATRIDDWDAAGHVQVFDLGPGLAVLLRDGGAPTPLLAAGAGANGTRDGKSDATGTSPSLLTRACDHGLHALPYFRDRPRVAVLGGHGALEVQCAVRHGAVRVDWAIGRPALRRAMEGLRGWLGLGDAVRIVDEAPRAFLHGQVGEGYDLIALPGAQPRHVLPTGLLPTPTPWAWTRQGLTAGLSALAPNGVLSLTVIGEPLAMRVLHTALAAVGPQAPWRHVVAAQGGASYGLLVRPAPLPMDESLQLYQHQRAVGRSPLPPELVRRLPWTLSPPPQLRYAPGAGFDNRIAAFLARFADGEAQAFVRDYDFDLGVVTDDRPALYDQTRYDRRDRWTAGSPPNRLWSLCGLVAALALLMGVRAVRRARVRGRHAAADVLALACVGAAMPLSFHFLAQRAELWAMHPGRGFAWAALAVPAGAGLGAALASRIPAWARTGPLALTLVATAALTAAELVLGPALEALAGVPGGAVLSTLALALVSIGLGATASALLVTMQAAAGPVLIALGAAVAVPWTAANAAFVGSSRSLWAAVALLLLASLLGEVQRRGRKRTSG